MLSYPFKLTMICLLAALGAAACGTENNPPAPTDAGGTGQTGGAANSGGTGATSTGGTATGGAPTSSGGTATGGTATGGAASGGKATGGTASGGKATGGTSSTGGTAGTGGTGGDRCDVGVYSSATPPTSLTITNGASIHDPSIILSGSTYYLFNSGLWTRTSTNLTSWQNISQVLYPNPSWIANYVTGVTDLWAPDVSYFNGTYHLYYAASTMGSNRSCIGHVTRTAMNSGSWTDDGGPVICTNVTSSVNYNAIDPNIILDQSGNPWMVFGSGWNGIQIVRLTSTGAVDSTSTVTAIATRSGSNVIEGAAMVRRCGYYYLFSSWDKCCLGASSTYNIRVGRSTSMTSGFVDKSGVALTQGGGTLLVGAGNGWVGPGGESVLFVGTRAYLVYHAYAATDGAFSLHISDLYWDDAGWPVTTATP
jgi:arabinan endo-1,5-alpha-L-arabinosidase